MKTIYNKFDKNVINALPLVDFPGKITVVLNESEADRAVDYLLSCEMLGVDTETRPAFRRGQNHKVALLQVATKDQCFLFRLNHIGLPDSLVRLLSNKMVPMIGLSWHDDLLSLHRRREFEPGWFIDIQDIIGNIGVQDKSLQKLYANLFGEKISKRQRLTNWGGGCAHRQAEGVCRYRRMGVHKALQRDNAADGYPRLRTEGSGGEACRVMYKYKRLYVQKSIFKEG